MLPNTPITKQIEHVDSFSLELDVVVPQRALKTLHDGQMDAAAVVVSAAKQIAEAAALAAACLSTGGKLAYVGAGSSGLLAVTDGLELPGTFGIDPKKIILILAGGIDARMILNSASEDDANAATQEIGAAGLGAGDCAVLVSASGTTPFTVSALVALNESGAATIAVTNNDNSPLLSHADLEICLPTPPEVLAGSTRMGAGTAQKIALNMFSTLLGIHLGHVHDGMMVNVVADNNKLKQRAIRIVARIADCSVEDARAHLERAAGSVKHAVLLANGARNPEDAERILSQHGGRLRDCLETLARSPS